jgi:predicted  nucleic acid-binding Zn-ribbon protein
MSPIEIKKMQVEYHKVYAARLDLELRIEEFKESIKKLEDAIAIQASREKELTEKINQAKQG